MAASKMVGNMDSEAKKRSFYTDWIEDNIRYSDLDPNGHVNNGAINAFFEDGRVKFRNDHMHASNSNVLTGFVLAKFCVEYLRPLVYPGTVDIGTSVIKVGNSSYTLIQGIFSDEDCMAVAEVVTVCLNNKTKKAKIIGDDLRVLLERLKNKTIN